MNHITAFMCIRLNSKRVPNKSIKMLAGRPLFCWSAETIDKLNIPFFINCNDQDKLYSMLDFEPKNLKIISRDPFLDTDLAKSEHHCMEFYNKIKSRYYLMTHCTSPFVNKATYLKTIKKVVDENHASAQTVEKFQTFGWFDNQPINFTIPREPTQDLKPIYIETMGAICYNENVAKMGLRINQLDCAFIEVDHIEGMDIDTEEDFIMAEKYAKFKLY